jgi:hypothetical protein
MHNVSGAVTAEAVSGLGIISHITIWRRVDGGIAQLGCFRNGDHPEAITDYGGSFMLKLAVSNAALQ